MNQLPQQTVNRITHDGEAFATAQVCRKEEFWDAVDRREFEKAESFYISGATAEALRGKELVRAINRVLQGELNPTNILQQAIKNYNL